MSRHSDNTVTLQVQDRCGSPCTTAPRRSAGYNALHARASRAQPDVPVGGGAARTGPHASRGAPYVVSGRGSAGVSVWGSLSILDPSISSILDLADFAHGSWQSQKSSNKPLCRQRWCSAANRMIFLVKLVLESARRQ